MNFAPYHLIDFDVFSSLNELSYENLEVVILCSKIIKWIFIIVESNKIFIANLHNKEYIDMRVKLLLL